MTTLRPGSAGAMVEDLQQQLQQLGFPIEVDGRYGPRTEAAVREFQQRHGLAVDGVAGDKTFAVMARLSPPKPGAGVTDAADKARRLAEQGAAGDGSHDGGRLSAEAKGPRGNKTPLGAPAKGPAGDKTPV